jgi:hypothetical protein
VLAIFSSPPKLTLPCLPRWCWPWRRKAPLVLGAVLALLPRQETGLVPRPGRALLLRGGGPAGLAPSRGVVFGPPVIAALPARVWRRGRRRHRGSRQRRQGAYVSRCAPPSGSRRASPRRPRQRLRRQLSWLPALLASSRWCAAAAATGERAVELSPGSPASRGRATPDARPAHGRCSLDAPDRLVGPRVAAPDRPFVLGALILAFLAGAWSPTDPTARRSKPPLGGERISTPPRQRARS